MSLTDYIVLVAVVVALSVMVLMVADVFTRRYRHRMRTLAAERAGESICQFARSLPYRQLDTAVIRRVYEAFEAEVGAPDCRVPIRTSDHMTDTLELDPDDLDELIVGLADGCGRSLDDYERNPFYARLCTVGDLVHFLCAQPKVQLKTGKTIPKQ